MRRDSMGRALDALTDLGLSKREALLRFQSISRRWTSVSQGFALFMGGNIRLHKIERIYSETECARWADDGGRA